MESLEHADNVRSGRTTDASKVPLQKVHNFWTDRWIVLKFLEEFPYAVFHWVAWNCKCKPTTSVGAFHRHDQNTGSKGLSLLTRPLDRAQIFRGVSIGYFSCSSVESLLHADDVRSGRTTDSTTVPAEKVYNFWSDRWIAPKFSEEFL